MIGLVGAGGVGRYAHLPSYRAQSLPVSVVCDVDAGVAATVAAEFSVPRWTTDLKVLLADPSVEIVDLATPPIGRAPLLSAIALAGKPTLIQKPFCVTRAEYAYLSAHLVPEVHWRLNMTGRHVSAWRKVKALIDGGAIGLPQTCTIINRDWWDRSPGRWDLDVADYVVYEIFVHHLDLLVYWFGWPSKVTGRAGVHPRQLMMQANRASILLDYLEGGPLVTLIDDWTEGEFAFASGHPFESVSITGSEGSIRASSERVELSRLGANAIELWHHPRPGQTLPGEVLETGWFPDSFGLAMTEFAAARGAPESKARDAAYLRDLTEALFTVAESLGSDRWLPLRRESATLSPPVS
ncbi:MAG: Gfo/Idh/MocA family oxidoreductase [Pseudomonadota bacterium]